MKYENKLILKLVESPVSFSKNLRLKICKTKKTFESVDYTPLPCRAPGDG